MSPAADYVENLLRNHGPFMLTHIVGTFSYGAQWGAVTPGGSHAVVITGIDTAADRITFNNPWGDVNQPTSINSILSSMEGLMAQSIRSVAYMR